jgi:hypothetical protein
MVPKNNFRKYYIITLKTKGKIFIISLKTKGGGGDQRKNFQAPDLKAGDMVSKLASLRICMQNIFV